MSQAIAFSGGRVIYQARQFGRAWRVVSGAVRLNQVGANVIHDEFASLAIVGDVIGAETLISGRYAFNAVALGPVQMAPWPDTDGRPSDHTLLTLLTTTEKRAAELVAMRAGEAAERVMRLIRLLRQNEPRGSTATRVFMPGGRDVADITGLSVETVARIVSRLQREGKLHPEQHKDFPLPGRYFRLEAGVLQTG